jgi:hypothetical protein
VRQAADIGRGDEFRPPRFQRPHLVPQQLLRQVFLQN